MIATNEQLQGRREAARNQTSVGSSERSTLASSRRGGDDTGEIRTALVRSRAELHEALGLVYRAYRATNLIEANRFGLRATKYHLLHSTHVFVARKEAELAGTLTLVRDGLFGLPMEDAYAYEVGERRAQGRKVAEVSCLADASFGKSNMLSVVLKLMSHMAQFARHNGVDDLLIAVHPHHVGFYERFIGFEVIGEETNYSAVCDNPAVPLALDLRMMPVNHPKAYHRFFGEPFAEVELWPRPMSVPVLAELRGMVDATQPAVAVPGERPLVAAA